jgi:hypothetical protein
MVFAPPADQRFSDRWTPVEADRVELLKLTVANDALMCATVAVVPLKAASAISAAIPRLTSKTGDRLMFDAGKIDVMTVARVPRVRQAEVSFQPWILTNKIERQGERDVVLLVMIGQVTARTKPGVYEGDLTLAVSGKRIILPLSVEVVNPGPSAGALPPIVAGLHSVDAGSVFSSGASDLTPQARETLQDEEAPVRLGLGLVAPAWGISRPCR